MNLFDVLKQYQKHLHANGIEIIFSIPKELEKVYLPFALSHQIEILDLITIYFFRRYKCHEGMRLAFGLEVNHEKCIIEIKSKTRYETLICSDEVQEFFWFMHLIFRNSIPKKACKIQGAYMKNKFRIQVPAWCKDM